MSIAMIQVKQKILNYVKANGGVVALANAVECGRLSDYSRMVSAYDALGHLRNDGLITLEKDLVRLVR